jgi:hypothetical protein
MREVIKIIGTTGRTSKEGKPYNITHLQVDDGTEAEFYGTDVEVGDKVEVFLHYGKIKAQKGKL